MLFNKILITLLFITILPMMASAQEKPAGELTILPYGNLKSEAYQEGKKIGYPETIQGLLLRETNGGRYRGAAQAAQNDPCYGVMQIKLDTAKFVLAKIWGLPKSDLLPDHQLRRKIRDDDVFNIKIAASYFNYLLSRFSGPARWDKAVLSYNFGPYHLQLDDKAYDLGGYVKSVRTLINTDVQRFNSVHNIN